MAGLVPVIHVLLSQVSNKDVDTRGKRGHDGISESLLAFNRACNGLLNGAL
jgi:hypothetical protein